jgi:hypothetical protein
MQRYLSEETRELFDERFDFLIARKDLKILA